MAAPQPGWCPRAIHGALARAQHCSRETLCRRWPDWQDQPILTQNLAGVGAERRWFPEVLASPKACTELLSEGLKKRRFKNETCFLQ